MNFADRTIAVKSVTGAILFEAIDSVEFDAKTAEEQRALDRITALSGDIIIVVGSRARITIAAIFSGAGGAVTRANLGAIGSEIVSRATDLGLRRVRPGYVAEART